jgi:hypothetical protein
MNAETGYSVKEETLTKYLTQEKIVSWKQLEDAFGISKPTLWRRLQNTALVTSLNNNRKYITLKEIVEENADDNGIWKSGDVVFSNRDSLNPTIVQIVEKSDAGWSMAEFENYLGTSPKQNVVDLSREEKIKRAKFGHKYIYFSATRSEEQIKARIKLEPKCGIKLNADDVKEAAQKVGTQVREFIKDAMEQVGMEDKDIPRADILMAGIMKPLKHIDSDRNLARHLENNPSQEGFYDLKKTTEQINDFQR